MKISKAAAPTFENKAAQQVYDAIMACPDNESAQMMTRAIVFDVMYRDVIKHRDFISKAMGEYQQKRIGKLAKTLQAVEKNADDDQKVEIAKAAVVLQTLSKAGADDRYEQWKLHMAAQRRHRDPKGRFAVEHTKIDYDDNDQQGLHAIPWQDFKRIYNIPGKPGVDVFDGANWNKPIRGKAADGSKIPHSDKQIKNYQLAYSQADRLIDQYRNHPGAQVHVNYGAYQKVGRPENLHDLISLNARPQSVAVSIDQPYDDPTGYDFYNMFNAVGAGDRGAAIQGAASQNWAQHGLNPRRLHTFNDNMSQSLPDYYKNAGYGSSYGNQPGAGLFRRLAQGSGLFRDTFPNAGPKALAAANAANFIGSYGPEAQRALGPSAQRITYRYRGTEKTPDDTVVRLNNAAKRQLKSQRDVDGKPMALNGANMMRALTAPRRNERGQQTVPEFVDYWRKRLPDANLNTLQRKSGHIPPSEGVILDKDGNVVTQAVGYGDDWYLPFNLKNLKALKGGSYVRTRTFGGPTTEDIYTGLLSGADQITVISWNGVYTVKFDDSFHGGRRYNDKAARMVARYGQLLDAVKSEQVELNDIEPNRRAEIRDKALRTARNRNSPQEVRFEEEKLLAEEKLNPKISKERDDAIKDELLQENAEKWGIPEGTTTNEVVERIRDVQATKNWQAMSPQQRTGIILAGVDPSAGAVAASAAADQNRAKWMAAERTRLTPDQLIKDGDLEDALTERRSDELTQYKENLSPLSLNGQGYYEALRALHEQFPYYLEEPTYHRWINPKDRRGRVVSGNRQDTGYIKPKHTRPEGALAGYYDKTVRGEVGSSGHGKYTADSQFKDSQHVPGDIKRQEEEQKAWQERRAELMGRVSGVAGRAKEGGKEKGDAAEERDATKDLYDHLKSLRDANLRSDHPVAPGAAWKQVTNDLRDNGTADEKALYDVLENMDEGRFQNEYDDNKEKLRGLLSRAVKGARVVFGNLVDNDKVSAFDRRGASPDPVKVDENDPSDLLDKLHKEMDLGSDFAQGKFHELRDVQELYRDDPAIQDLREKHNLPGLGSPTWDADIRNLTEELRKELRHAKIVRTARGDEGPMREVEGHAMGLARLAQLGRRWKELEESEPKAEVVQQGQDQVIHAFLDNDGQLLSPQQVAQQAQQAQRPAIGSVQVSPEEQALIDQLSPDTRARLGL